MIYFDNKGLSKTGNRKGALYLADLTAIDEFLSRRGRTVEYEIPDSKRFATLQLLVEKLRDRPIYRLEVTAKKTGQSSVSVSLTLTSHFVHVWSSTDDDDYVDGLKLFDQLVRKKDGSLLEFRTIMTMYAFLVIYKSIFLASGSIVYLVLSSAIIFGMLWELFTGVVLWRRPIYIKEKYEHKSFWETKHYDIKMGALMLLLGIVVTSAGIPQMVQRLYHKVVDQPAASVAPTPTTVPTTAP